MADPADLFARALAIETAELERSRERANTREFRHSVSEATRLCQQALTGPPPGKLILTGVGKSGKVADKIAATLASTGSPALYLHPTEGLHGDLGIVSPGDVVIVLSQTGNSDEVLRLLPPLRARGVSVIAFCGARGSQLVEQSAVWLDTSVEHEACPHDLAPTSSTTLALVYGDALAVTLMQVRGFDADAFARNHPAGALGRRLTLRVADLMHTGAKVGCVMASAPMSEVVTALTKHPLGAVLVTAGRELLGIITDGDLRRALAHQQRFFSFTAEQVMTANPITIGADAMAHEALALMERRKSQISVLPVVRSGTQHWEGVLRLHDLVQSL